MKDIIVVTNASGPNAREEAYMRLILVAPISPRRHLTPVRGRWFCDTQKYGRAVLGHSQTGTYYVREWVQPDLREQDYELRREVKWVYPGVPRFPVGFFFDASGPGAESLPFLVLEEFNIFLPRDEGWYGNGSFAFSYGRYNDDYTVRWKHA